MPDVATAATHDHRKTLWLIFVVAAVLLVLFEGFFLFADTYLRPPAVQWLETVVSLPSQDAFLAESQAQQLFSAMLSWVGLVFDPFLFFLAFYWIGRRTNFDSTSRYVHIFAYSFGGGLVGSLLSLAILYASGASFFGQPSALAYSNLAMFVISPSIRMAFTAFAGVLVGQWRASRAAPQMQPTASISDAAATPS